MDTSFEIIIHQNRFFAPLTVNNVDGYAHLDTGANRSNILAAHAKGLKELGAKTFSGAFAKDNSKKVNISELRLLNKTIVNQEVFVQQELGGDAVNFSVLMALGCDILLLKPLYLDCVNNKIAFINEEEICQFSPDCELHVSFEDEIPFLKIDLHSTKLGALFDTGAALSVIDEKLLDKFPNLFKIGEPIEVEDATGEKQDIPTFICKKMKMGEIEFENLQVLSIDLSHAQNNLKNPIDFIIGYNLMKNLRWLINKSSGKILAFKG